MAAAKKATTWELPEGFTPGPSQVIIGRGKKLNNHEGNALLLEMVKSHLASYESAMSKLEKSAVLAKIVYKIKKQNSDLIGFVKQDPKTKRWLGLSDNQSRVSVAQAFRDLLFNNYKSSRHNKQVKRKMEKEGIKGTSVEPDAPRFTVTSAYQASLQAYHRSLSSVHDPSVLIHSASPASKQGFSMPPPHVFQRDFFHWQCHTEVPTEFVSPGDPLEWPPQGKVVADDSLVSDPFEPIPVEGEQPAQGCYEYRAHLTFPTALVHQYHNDRRLPTPEQQMYFEWNQYFKSPEFLAVDAAAPPMLPPSAYFSCV